MKKSTLEEILARDGRLVYTIKGTSMEPMLRQDRDLVMISVPASHLKKYDVALYKTGGRYYLHRVIRVQAGHYLIRGDNTYHLERVPFDAVLGVLTDFRHKDRQISANAPAYRLYARVWNLLYPLRHFLIRCRRLIRRIGVRGNTQ